MPEATTLLIIAGLTAAVFGAGVITTAKIMLGRKTGKRNESDE